MNGDIEIIGNAARDSLFILATCFLGYKDITWNTHGEIIDVLEGDSKRKLICVPRGCLKSSLACVAYPIWLLLRNPDLRILIDSELFTNSCTFLREIKQHILSEEMKLCFGVFKTKVWREEEIIISQRVKRLKEASISCGGIGTTKVGQHFDVIIGDDYNSPNNTNTPDNAAKVVQHYRYNLSILEPTGTYVLIGTRYSENDLIGHIINNEVKAPAA